MTYDITTTKKCRRAGKFGDRFTQIKEKSMKRLTYVQIETVFADMPGAEDYELFFNNCKDWSSNFWYRLHPEKKIRHSCSIQ